MIPVGDISWRFAFGLMLTVALVSGLAGGLVSEIRFARSCALGPDAPFQSYTRPILRCELPWWWVTSSERAAK